jgi:hypothetical protein
LQHGIYSLAGIFDPDQLQSFIRYPQDEITALAISQTTQALGYFCRAGSSNLEFYSGAFAALD